MAFGFTYPYAMLQSPTAMSPGNVQQMAAMGNAMQAMPAGNPMQAAMQSMAPSIPMYQGSGGGGMMMPRLPGSPQLAQQVAPQRPGGGLMSINPQQLQTLLSLFKRPDPTTNLAYNTPNAATSLGGNPQLPGYD